MNKQAPIGIFDSGVGGSSIWTEIHELLPLESTLYLADSKYAPYGNRSKEEIIALSRKNTEFLIARGCKLIVVACNTATTNAISVLRETYDIPFIGIEPAIKPAALQTHTKSIGILATQGTLNSELFHQTSELFSNGIQITEVVGTGLVPLIEQGKLDSPELTALLKKYLQPMLDAHADYVVLGCSHYPYLIPQLKELLPPHIKIIDSGAAVALQTKAVLQKNKLLQTEKTIPRFQFFSNAKTDTLQTLLKVYASKIEVSYEDF
ncbi:MAG: glutamate racemase [Bacteroidota bacterium]